MARRRQRSRLGPTGRRRGAWLVLNGATRADFRAARDLSGRLCRDALRVAVDGGLNRCLAEGCPPDLWVGDGDSLRRTVPPGVERVRLPRDKDRSDLAAALEELAARRVRGVLVLAGVFGGRLDHEWANLLELAARAKSFAALIAPGRRGTALVTACGCELKTRPGSNVSLFALAGSASVSLRGTRWELRRRRLVAGSRGLSNVTGERLTLEVHRGAVALLPLPPDLL